MSDDQESERVRRLLREMDQFEASQAEINQNKRESTAPPDTSSGKWVLGAFNRALKEDLSLVEFPNDLELEGGEQDSRTEGIQGPLYGADYPPVKIPLRAGQAWAETKLKERRERFDQGDTPALFEAVRFCYLLRVPLPDWVGYGILEGVLKIENFEAGSWDVAFGKPFPSKTRLPERRRHLELASAVANEVGRLSLAGTPIDNFIWEGAAENINADNREQDLFEGLISAREVKTIWQGDTPVVQYVKAFLKERRRKKTRKRRAKRQFIER
jgi:hypothetical protein